METFSSSQSQIYLSKIASHVKGCSAQVPVNVTLLSVGFLRIHFYFLILLRSRPRQSLSTAEECIKNTATEHNAS